MKNSEKTCICCGAVGDSQTLFGKNAANEDGRSKYCKDCIRAKSKNQESKRKEYQKAYREGNKERLSKLAADKYKRRPEVVEAARARREAQKAAEKVNKELEAQKDRFNSVWAAVSKLKNIKNRKASKDAKFWVRRDLQSRKPAWVEWDSFRDVYTKAKNLTEATGIQYEVDHIYPLRSDCVCGLHTPDNLHVMQMRDNAKKRNRPYGPAGDELWDPGHPSTYWPDESNEVSVAMKAHAATLLHYAEEYPAVASALIDFYRLTGEPEHLHIEWLLGFSDSSTGLDDLLSTRKHSLAPEGLLTNRGTIKMVRPSAFIQNRERGEAVRKPSTKTVKGPSVEDPVSAMIEANGPILDLLIAQLEAASEYLDMTLEQVLERLKASFSAEANA